MKISLPSLFKKKTALAAIPKQRINAVAQMIRSYAGAQMTRLTTDWQATGASQDSETLLGLRTLRFRSRQLIRDNHTAKNALHRVIPNNVIGLGVSMQPEVRMLRGNKLDEKTNAKIKKAWDDWCRADSCSVNGLLTFHDIELLLMKSVPSDGEVLVRKFKKKFGKSNIPFALQLLESDYLIDFRNAHADNGNQIRMGVERDEFERPLAYWLYPSHPGDYQFGSFQPAKFKRIPAEEMLHLYLFDRVHQTRGVPWLHAAMMKMRNMAGYDEAEVIAARASACIMGFLETPDGDYGDLTDPNIPSEKKDNMRNMDLEAGVTKVLSPGEKFSGFAPQRPGGQYEPFMRKGERDIGAAVGASYESISKDYSQSNYSSSRLALLDDRDQWRILQQWIISHFHQPVYEEWLDAAVMSGTLDIPNYFSNREMYLDVDWKPRGWEWVDPLKEVQAHRMAVRAGFELQADVIAQRGGDIEDAMRRRKREIELAEEYGLIFDSDAAVTDTKGSVQSDSGAQAEADAATQGDGTNSASGEDSTGQDDTSDVTTDEDSAKPDDKNSDN